MNTQFNLPTKIIIGSNTINQLKTIIKPQQKVFLVTTKDTAPLSITYNQIKEILKDNHIIHFDQVMPNPSTEIVDAGVALAREHDIDVIVGVGGGSTLDTTKMIRLLYNQDYEWTSLIKTYTDPFYQVDLPKSLPYFAIPTTTGTGSEVTQAAVITHNNFKETIFHPHNFADIAILDPNLVTSLPSKLTAITTFDAFTHSFESYISQHANSYNRQLALKSIELIIINLPLTLENLRNENYREQLLVAQNFAGQSLATAGANLPHPLSEVIGSISHISHGEALAIVFANFIKFSTNQHQKDFQTINHLFQLHRPDLYHEQLEITIRNFINSIGLKQSFSEHNLSKDEIKQILNHPLWNHLPFMDSASIKQIISSSI